MPVGEGEGDDPGQQQAFVGNGIEYYPEAAALVVMPCNVAVEAIAYRGKREEENGRHPLPFLRMPALHPAPVIDRHHHEHRDHEDAGQGDFIGGGHRLKSY